MAEFASNGKGNLGVTLGAIGTGLGLFSNNGTGLNILGNNNNYVTKDELNYVQEIARKDSEIALLKSEQNTEIKIADVYRLLKADLNTAQREQADWNASQSVINTQLSSAIATNNASIAQLQNCCNSITKTVIPNTSVCPGWGTVTVTPTGSISL